MKYNLQNFPSPLHEDSIAEMCNWKENFEKELREKLNAIRNNKKKFPFAPRDYFLLREILGEDSS